MDYALYIFSDSFNSLLVTHTILDILFVLIVRFADIDIEYYSIQRFIHPSCHSCIYHSLKCCFYAVFVNVFVDKLYQ
jgi:hypothetical protein